VKRFRLSPVYLRQPKDKVEETLRLGPQEAPPIVNAAVEAKRRLEDGAICVSFPFRVAVSSSANRGRAPGVSS
jgi:hypothetical protein